MAEEVRYKTGGGVKTVAYKGIGGGSELGHSLHESVGVRVVSQQCLSCLKSKSWGLMSDFLYLSELRTVPYTGRHHGDSFIHSFILVCPLLRQQNKVRAVY